MEEGMQTKIKKNEAVDESSLELKYCERCGLLRLRPVGGGQIYCAICAREMAQLPPSSHEPDVRRRRHRRWGANDAGYENYEGDLSRLDATGGVA
jgi:hypothetical protein